MRLRNLKRKTCACLLAAAAGVCLNAQETFEAKYESGTKANPASVHVLLRTSSRQDTFQLFEAIPITLEFISTGAMRYSIEMDETMNSAGMSNRFYVSDSDSTYFTVEQFLSGGVVCCDSDKRTLSSHPVELNREMTDYIRFTKPGTYRVIYATNRVFSGFSERHDFRQSKVSLTSNQLTLTILPDDEGWNSRELGMVLSRLRDPEIKGKYIAASRRAKALQLRSETGADYAYKNIVSQTEYARARTALNALDTPQAIKQRVAMMEMESEADLEMSRKYGAGTILPEPLLASTTRADLFVEAMDKRASEPDFRIDYNFAYWWQKLLIQKEHPEIFRPFLDDSEREKRIREYMSHYFEAQQRILARLEQLAPSKVGKGKEATNLTIKVILGYRATK